MLDCREWDQVFCLSLVRLECKLFPSPDLENGWQQSTQKHHNDWRSKSLSEGSHSDSYQHDTSPAHNYVVRVVLGIEGLNG